MLAARVLALAVSTSVVSVYAYNNGMAATPPMGWNTWCTSDLCGLLDRCTEKEIHEVADAMVSSGMRDAGYEYVNLDDCWADTERDANGRLQGQPLQFPSGMAALADYVHSKGLKLGLYTCVGTETCKKNRPGSYGHFTEDAETFASWGVDFVKADFCHVPSNESDNTQNLYQDFSQALNASGRPMLFSLCEWGEKEVWEWGSQAGQMYRVQMDHMPVWHYPPQAAGVGYGQGTADVIEWMGALNPSKWAKQYGWMDPDFLMTLMLENYTKVPIMTFEESKSEFSFWALWASPLIVATDPRDMSQQKRSILLNNEVIAVNQDVLFAGGHRLYNNTSGAQAWMKPLANGDVAILLYNKGDNSTWGGGGPPVNVSVTWEELGWTDDFSKNGTASVALRDLWLHENVAPSNPAVGHSVTLEPRSVAMLRASNDPVVVISHPGTKEPELEG